MSDTDELSQEDKERIKKSALQLASYVNFMRWSANFKREEIKVHPTHGKKIFLLSVMQSGRFSFLIQGDTVILGVQGFECAWMASMPFACAYVDDRLYLQVDAVECLGAKMSGLTLGIFVDDEKKLSAMKMAKYLQLVRVSVHNGSVTEVGRAIGLGFPIKSGLIKALKADVDRIRQNDSGRFF